MNEPSLIGRIARTKPSTAVARSGDLVRAKRSDTFDWERSYPLTKALATR
jgi:hypothetical protein